MGKKFLVMSVLFLIVVLAVASLPALGGNDIYFVTYNHHIKKGETELMIMTDFTSPAQRVPGFGDYMSSMLELEYGVSDQFATELMLEGFFDFTTSSGMFTGYRWENRYRLNKESNLGLNPMLYMEYEDLDPATRFKMEVSGREDGVGEPAGEEPGRERILETRLVLSKDIGRYNVAFNWINETDLQRSGFTDFGYALGIRYNLVDQMHGEHSDVDKGEKSSSLPDGTAFSCPMHPEQNSPQPGKCKICGMELAGASERMQGGGEPSPEHQAGGWKPVSIGIEFYGGLGNSNAFGGPFDQQQHYVSPIIAFHPGENMMIHIAPAFGLTGVSDDLIRTAISFEF